MGTLHSKSRLTLEINLLGISLNPSIQGSRAWEAFKSRFPISRRRTCHYMASSGSIEVVLVQLSPTVLPGVNARETPDAGSASSKQFSCRPFIRVQVSTRLLEKEDVIRETGVGG